MRRESNRNDARRGSTLLRGTLLALSVALGGCNAPLSPTATSGPSAPAPPGTVAATAVPPTRVPAPLTTPQPPPPILPFDEAVTSAADALFSGAKPPQSPDGRHVVVIDPLIEGTVGVQLTATRSMESRIADIMKAKFLQYELRPLTTNTLAQSPLVLLGSFTGVDRDDKPSTAREVYRIWLVLADLKSGKIVARSTARARPEGVDLTPTPAHVENPAWLLDAATEAYLKTCEGKIGEALDQAYVEGIFAAALIADAVQAYEAGRYQQALELYESAKRVPGGDQLRVYNGLYLTNWKLGRTRQAADAFTRLVGYGLSHERLAIKFLFRRGSTDFENTNAPYAMWLERMAHETERRNACVEIIGHTSRTGPAMLNERLSQLRAEYVRSRLVDKAAPLARRTRAHGVGSREVLIGTGTDDARDALDRRVEFKPFACS